VRSSRAAPGSLAAGHARVGQCAGAEGRRRASRGHPTTGLPDEIGGRPRPTSAMTGHVGAPRRWMFMQASRPNHRSKRRSEEGGLAEAYFPRAESAVFSSPACAGVLLPAPLGPLVAGYGA
jgi:hypothetical protein